MAFNLSEWIKGTRDLRADIFPANDNNSDLECMAGIHSSVRDLFNPVLAKDHIIHDLQKSLGFIRDFLFLVSENLNDHAMHGRIPQISARCRKMAETITTYER